MWGLKLVLELGSLRTGMPNSGFPVGRIGHMRLPRRAVHKI